MSPDDLDVAYRRALLAEDRAGEADPGTTRVHPTLRKGIVTTQDPLQVDGLPAVAVTAATMFVDRVVWLLVDAGRRLVIGPASHGAVDVGPGTAATLGPFGGIYHAQGEVRIGMGGVARLGVREDVVRVHNGAQFRAEPGSEAAPGVSFAPSPDQGLWRAGAATIGLTSGAAGSSFLLGTGGLVPQGDARFAGRSNDTASSPSFAWEDRSDTGWYHLAGTGPEHGFYATVRGSWRLGVTNTGLRVPSTASVYTSGYEAAAVFDTNSNGWWLHAGNNYLMVSRNGGVGLFVGRNGSNGAAAAFYRSGAQVGTIAVTTTATAYNTSSDYRLKRDVRPLDGALDRVRRLRPVRHRWNVDPDAPEVDGFLAHEVADVVPEAVTGTKDEVDEDGAIVPQLIDVAKLVPLLVAAVAELDGKVAATPGGNRERR